MSRPLGLTMCLDKPPVLWTPSSEDLVDQKTGIIQPFSDRALSSCAVLRCVMGAREAKWVTSRPVSEELTTPGRTGVDRFNTSWLSRQKG